MTDTRPTIAVIGAPSLAKALADVGFRIVTDPEFRVAAIAVNEELARNAATPVVADLTLADQGGFTPYLSMVASRTRLVLIATRPEHPTATGGIAAAHVVPAPTTVADIMRAIGYQPSAAPQAHVRVEVERGHDAAPMQTPLEQPAEQPVSERAVAEAFDVASANPITSPEPAPAAEPQPGSAAVTNADAEDAALAERVAAANAAAESMLADDRPKDAPTPTAADTTPAADALVAHEVGDMPDFLLELTSPTPAPAPAPVTFEEPPAPVTVDAPVPIRHAPRHAPTPQDEPPTPAWQSMIASPENPAPTVPVVPPAWPTPTTALPASAVTPMPAIPSPAAQVPVAPAAAPPAWPAAPAPAAQETRAASVQAPAPVPAPAPAPTVAQQDFWTAPPTQPQYQTVGAPPRGAIVFVFSGSGGVGKTSTAINLAKLASERNDMRVTLVDANRGQGDVRKRLKVPENALPTVYDVARSGSASAGLVHPAAYNQYRVRATNDPLNFAVVLAPPRGKAEETPASAYAAVIDYAASMSELVIVDNQIAEDSLSDIYREVVVPRLRSGAWGVGVYNDTAESAQNIFDRLTDFVDRDDVPAARMLLVASNVREFAEDDAERITRRLDNHGTFAGALLRDPRYADESNVGKFRVELDALAPTLRNLLHIITGRHEFAPIEAPSPTKRSLLARWMKR